MSTCCFSHLFPSHGLCHYNSFLPFSLLSLYIYLFLSLSLSLSLFLSSSLSLSPCISLSLVVNIVACLIIKLHTPSYMDAVIVYMSLYWSIFTWHCNVSKLGHNNSSICTYLSITCQKQLWLIKHVVICHDYYNVNSFLLLFVVHLENAVYNVHLCVHS